MWAITSARNASGAMTDHDGMAATALGWTACSLIGALPFVMTGAIPTFTGAVFEAMSGLTTTGATVLADVEGQSHAVLFWRALLNWLGGMGIVVLSIALLPGLNVGGSQLFRAEVPGIVNDRLVPKIRETAKRLWGIYILLTLIEAVLLRLFGMSLFDAVIHSLTSGHWRGFTASRARGGRLRHSDHHRGVHVPGRHQLRCITGCSEAPPACVQSDERSLTSGSYWWRRRS